MTTIAYSLLDDLPLTHQAVIPESYLDEMGHMNVMWYTHLFSQASGNLLKLIGQDREYFETQHRGSFALETHVRYYSELRAGRHASVRTRLLGRSDKRVHFMHFMTDDDDQLLATTAEYVSAHIDMQVRRMVAMSAEIAAAFDRLLVQHQRLAWEAPVCGIMKP